MSRLWIFEAREYAEEGATRWEVMWHTQRRDIPGRDRDDIDFDEDLEENVETFTDEPTARARAKEVAAESFFGCAMLEKQIATRADGMPAVYGEWAQAGEREEILP